MSFFSDIIFKVLFDTIKKIVENDKFSVFEGKSLPDWLFLIMKLYHPESPAIRFEGKETSRAEYIKMIKNLSKGLYAIGVKEDDGVVSIVEDELLEEGPLMLALMLRGAYAYNLRPDATPATIEVEKNRDPRSANCRVGFFTKAIIEEKGEGLYEFFDKIIILGWGEGEKPEPNDKVTFYTVGELVELGKKTEAPKVNYSLSKLALVVSTSGSTAEKGDNKGVMLTTKSLIALLCQTISSGDKNEPSYTPCGRYLARGPYSIIAMFFLSYLLPLATAMTIVYDKDITSVNIGPKLQEHKINGVFASGPEWECIDHQIIAGEVTDLSGLVCAYFGGAGTSPKTLESLNAGLKKCGAKVQISNGYGATEVGSAVVSQGLHYKEKESKRQLITNGVEFPGTKVSIRDKDGKLITEKNKRGIICIGSNTLMDGYYGRPEQTNEMVNENDEYVTNDIGYFDEDNELYVYGRGGDKMKSKDGEDLYLFDIADEIYYQFNERIKRVHIFNSEENAIICLVPDNDVAPDDELGKDICRFAEEKFNVGVKGFSFWPFYPISRARKLDKELMYSEMTPYAG